MQQTLTVSPNILATRCRIFQTMNSVRSSILILKYHQFTPSGCKDIGIRKFEFMTKTQFLLLSKRPERSEECFVAKIG